MQRSVPLDDLRKHHADVLAKLVTKSLTCDMRALLEPGLDIGPHHLQHDDAGVVHRLGQLTRCEGCPLVLRGLWAEGVEDGLNAVEFTGPLVAEQVELGPVLIFLRESMAVAAAPYFHIRRWVWGIARVRP